ncbi:MAG: aminotransferase class V-fold PLP-dependent enzyme [Thermodesulfobacteriota bacterium]
MNWKSIYEAYPVNRDMIWLNNCGTTPAGKHNREAMAVLMEGYARRGVLAGAADLPKIGSRIKAILADLLHCGPEEVALVHNTAEGMNFISHGLALESGDEIILLENEYPSNVYPWRHWAKKGITLRTAPMGENPADFLEELRKQVTDRTRVIAVSAVHWCTGMPLPLAEIGAICKDRGITFVVDGAQGVGMQPLAVKRMHIDYMAFSAWKWLMGPVGLGAIYIRKEKLADLEPIFIGTDSVVDAEEYLPYKEDLKPDADRFTFSSPSLNDWVYFLSSLEFLRNIGFETVRNRIFELTDYLNHQLKQLGFRICADRFSDYPTGITVCEKENVPAGRILAGLKARRIVAAERLGKVRLSPHIYLSTQQLDEAARALADICDDPRYSAYTE